MASGKKRTQRGKASATRTTVRPKSAASAGVATAPRPAAVRTPTTPAATKESISADAPVRRSDAVDWPNEYSYVIGDLKQMAVVSVGLFAVMIAIGYFL